MKIAAFVKLNVGVDYHRLDLPFNHYSLDSGDSVLRIYSGQELKKGILRNVDIVIFSRECPFNFDTILECRKEMGFKIVVDIDDYWYLYPEHYLTNDWLRRNTSEKIMRSMREADMVFCTHEKLQQRIKSFNENVHILPNALPYGNGQFYFFTKPEKPAVIYTAGISHLHDLRSIEPALKLCGSDPQVSLNSTFILAGYNTKTPRIWDIMVNIVANYGSYKKSIMRPLPHYMDHYNWASIAIAPLLDNDFNRYKSNLKILEAGCKQLPIVASAMHPYTLDDGVKGVHLCKTARDWYNEIKKLVLSPQLVEEEGVALYEHVKKTYDLREINKKRNELFKQLL